MYVTSGLLEMVKKNKHNIPYVKTGKVLILDTTSDSQQLPHQSPKRKNKLKIHTLFLDQFYMMILNPMHLIPSDKEQTYI